MNRSHWY